VKIVVDMNLSPEWIRVLASSGWSAQHWSRIGKGDAEDDEIFRWARENDHIILTQDLDFPQILFAAASGSPSVILLRVDNELDEKVRARVCAAIAKASAKLLTGAILVVDRQRVRLRELPIKPV